MVVLLTMVQLETHNCTPLQIPEPSPFPPAPGKLRLPGPPGVSPPLPPVATLVARVQLIRFIVPVLHTPAPNAAPPRPPAALPAPPFPPATLLPAKQQFLIVIDELLKIAPPYASPPAPPPPNGVPPPLPPTTEFWTKAQSVTLTS